MQEKDYSLKTILATLVKTKDTKVKKRVIFSQAPIDGISSKWVVAFFISLPILLYIGIFNPSMFAMLGIAQAIIFYIVFLSMVMILIFALTFINNNKVIRQIQPSWSSYFPNIDLPLVLSSGASPYRDFFKHYGQALEERVEDENLHTFLLNAFEEMKEQNKDLLEAMQRDNGKRDKREKNG